MTVSKQVTLKDGTVKNVFAQTDADLKEAVKSVEKEKAPVYPNINHPVQKGHDLVAIDPEVNKVLVDGTGAHNSPYNAIDDNGNETGNSDVTAAGLDEPAYKSVPVGSGTDNAVIEPTKAEVAAAKKDSEPADEITPEPAKEK